MTWAPFGVLSAVVVDPSNRMDEPWVLIFAIPGFLGGVLFSAVLATRARGRSLLELTLRRSAAWGGAAGLATGALPFFIGEPTGRLPVPLLATIVMGSVATLSALSAAGSLALAQHAERRLLQCADRELERLAAPHNDSTPPARRAPTGS
jgi:hypothetical protein